MSGDAELMRRVQTGDEAAFGLLMERWELPVKGLLARLLQNASEAEELAQDTFVRVWQQREKYRAGAEFRPWVFAIAVNLARHRLRWWRRRPVVSLDAWTESGRDLAGGGLAAGAALERSERAESVRHAIAELPVDLREALVLAEYEQLSHLEIAAATGGTAKAVESRLYRARALLRKALTGKI
ncbi:MAG: hypothetical protein RL324_945 [Verrucomicrobiota bacterium]